MARLLFDIEADGLLPELSVIWCIVAIDVDTKQEYEWSHEDVVEGVKALCAADEVIGHNILGYDIPAIERLYPDFTVAGKATDTLILSKLLYPNLAEVEYAKGKECPVPASLIGRHSLEAWGFRLGQRKMLHEDFSQFSPEMLEYARNDRSLNVKLYDLLISRIASQDAVDLEMKVAKLCFQQEFNGFPFDSAGAAQLSQRLTARKDEIEQELRGVFPPREMQLKTKVKLIPFNPGSRQQIAERLMEKGWVPTEFSPSGQPKVDDDVLGSITNIPEAALLAEYFLIQKRLGQLIDGKQAWISNVRNGRIHGRVDTLGTGTFRCSHSSPNMAQVPSCAAPYGKECRALFYAPPGWRLLGCDVAKLELMVLGHYMNDAEFSRVLMSGDVHQLLADVYGTDRRTGKTVTYAFLYGAGLQKLGSIVAPTASEQKQVSAGKKIRKNMEERLPSLSNLIEGVKAKVKKQGSILALDKRVLFVRSEHAALNYLCQSAGAIICKRWVVNFHEALRLRGFSNGSEYQQVAFVHDEVQVLVREGLEDEIGKLCVSAIEEAGRYYNLRLPITGEYSSGSSWADTH